MPYNSVAHLTHNNAYGLFASTDCKGVYHDIHLFAAFSLRRFAAHYLLDGNMTKSAASRPLPPNWSNDSLSGYLDVAFRNILATFVSKKQQFAVLETIDRCFSTTTESLSETQEALGPLFLTRSHAAFRTECQLAMSGQCTESFCIGRSCLEFALYGLQIAENPVLEEVWLQRHKNEETSKRVRSKFSNRSILNTLATVDRELHATVERLYERTIDYGGHPNERSVTSNMSMESIGEEVLVRQFYLQVDSLALEHALKTAAQIGLGALYIFKSVFPDKFVNPDLAATMNQLREAL